jgi:hypothetical protein
MSKRRSKWVNKTFTIANATPAGDYTFSFVTDKGYGHVEAVAFAERTNGKAAGSHPYLIGLKQTHADQVIYDPVPKSLLLASGEENNQNFLAYEERFIRQGTQMVAGGLEYSITVRTLALLDEDLVLDVTFKHTNYEVNP